MLRDHRQALQRRRARAPAVESALPALREVGLAASVFSRVGGVDLAQPCGHGGADLRDEPRVGLDVRVAGRMHITLGPVEPGRHAELANEIGRREVARLARLHLRVARLLKQERQPAVLEFGAGAGDQIGAAGTCDQARLGLDMVWVLQGAGRHRDLDQRPAEFLRECAPFGLACEDLDGGLRRHSEDGAYRERGACRRTSDR